MKDPTADNDDVINKIGIDFIPGNPEEFDGFELIRQYLNDLKNSTMKGGHFSKDLLSACNDNLIERTYSELDNLSGKISQLQLVKYNKLRGRYVPTGMPEHLLDRYAKTMIDDGVIANTDSVYENEDVKHHALFSLVANTVANSIISGIEVEKIITGDPALYKEKASKTKTLVDVDVNGVGRTIST
jgi:hypothetical protein